MLRIRVLGAAGPGDLTFVADMLCSMSGKDVYCSDTNENILEVDGATPEDLKNWNRFELFELQEVN